MRARAVLFFLLASCVAPPVSAQPVITIAPGTGQELVASACAVCHSLSYIPMNSPFMTPAVWTAEVAKMRAAYGAPIDDESAKEITAYLVSHYGAP
jgi:mono/diheme cytochrome c family protein